jgi:hypothetical protein
MIYQLSNWTVNGDYYTIKAISTNVINGNPLEPMTTMVIHRLYDYQNC